MIQKIKLWWVNFKKQFIHVVYVDKQVVVQGESRIFHDTYHNIEKVEVPVIVVKQVPMPYETQVVVEKEKLVSINFDDFEKRIKKSVSELITELSIERRIEVQTTVKEEKEIVKEKYLYNNAESIEQSFAQYALDSFNSGVKSDESTTKKIIETASAYTSLLSLRDNDTAKREILCNTLRAWSEGLPTPTEYLRMFRGVRA